MEEDRELRGLQSPLVQRKLARLAKEEGRTKSGMTRRLIELEYERRYGAEVPAEQEELPNLIADRA